MKRYLLLGLFAIGSLSSINGQSDFWKGLNGPYGGTIYDLVSPSAGVMIASTSNGVYRSVDSGVTWLKVTIGSDLSFTDLEVGGGKIFVTTTNGIRIYSSADAGVTWTQFATNGNGLISIITKIKVAPNGFIYLVDGSNGRLYKSSAAGGNTFTNTSVGSAITDLDIDNLNNIYVSTTNLGIRSTSNGTTFTSSAGTLANANVLSTVINSGGVIFASTATGPQKSSVANGTTYVAIATGLVGPFTGLIDLDASGNIYYANNSSFKIFTSTAASAGAVWSAGVAYPANFQATTSYFLTTATWNLGFGNGGVFATSNSGLNWTQSSSGIKALPATNKIAVTKNNYLLMASSSSLGVFLSPDNGTTWTLSASSTANTNRRLNGFLKLSPANNNNMLGYGPDGVIVSLNDGINWNQQTTVAINDCVSADGNTLFSYASTGTTLLKSIDQGQTWPSTPITGLPGTPTKIQIDGSGKLYFKVANEVYKVDNPAVSPAVAVKLTSITATTIQDIQVVGTGIYVLGNSSVLYSSTDGGATFLSKVAPASSSALWVYDSKNMFIRSTANNFHLSIDGGGTWDLKALSDAESTATDAVVLPNTFLCVATTNSVVNRSLFVVIPPAAPTALAVVGSTFNGVELLWTDNANNEEDHIIESSLDNGSTYKVIPFSFKITGTSAVNKISLTVPGLTKATPYKFRVKTVNHAGSSVYSNEVSTTTVDRCVSAIPNNRSWSAVAVAEVGSTPSGITPYTSSVVNIVSVPSSPNDYTVSQFDFNIDPIGALSGGYFTESCGTVFLGEGDAIANGNGTWNGTNTLVLKWQSNPLNDETFQATTTFTLNPTDPVPASPSIAGYLYSGSEILLNWNSIPFGQQYIIERSTVSGGPYTTLTTLNFPTVTYIDKNLTLGVTYYYRIYAKNTAQSPASPEVGVKLVNSLFRAVENDIQLNFENQQGIAWGDLDGDGDEDIASPSFTNNAGQNVPPVFYENMGNGKDFTRRDLTVLASENTGISRSINIFDFNNDGRLDLYIARLNSLDLLLINNGSWDFTKTTVEETTDFSNVDFKGAAAADYDKDGLVDMFISNSKGGINLNGLLLKNTAGASFAAVTAGPLTSDGLQSRTSSWADYDNDNDLDLFVSNSAPGQPNRLYKNDGNGSFTQVIGLIFDTDIMTSTRTSSWGDIDNDGDLDLYIGSQSGSASPLAVDRLYKNNGDGTFTSITGGGVNESATVTYGSCFGDIDNDGDLDLIIINGGANSIFINNGTGTFTKSTVTEMMTHPGILEVGGAMADFDKDGFLDIYPPKGSTSSVDLPNFLYRNLATPSASKNWIEIKLVGTLSNKAAIGTRITVTTTTPARTQIREIASSTGNGSGNSLIAHFGLGTAPSINTIQIKWPSGFVQTISNVTTINQVLTIAEDVRADFTFAAPATLNKNFSTTTFQVAATVNFSTISGITLSYRKISGSAFTSLAGVLNSGKWEFPIQESFFDGNGMEYYFIAKNGSNQVGRLPLDPATNFYTYLNYKESDNAIPGDRLGFGGAIANWKIFTIPFELGTNGNAAAVFDELKGLTDKVDWRMVTYKDNVAWGEYPNDFSSFTRGKGYFINIRASIDIKVPEAAASNNRKTLFQLPIKKGWNQVGNPYLTSIAWADVVTLNGLTGTAAQLKTFVSGNYSNATILQPFEGGFVLADADATIKIPFQGQTAAGGRTSQGLEEGDWIMPIALKQADVENTFGGVGMVKAAQASFDRFDDFNAPRFIDFIEMNFNHPEHFVKQFARDIMPLQPEYTWSFKVDGNQPGVASMNWDNESLNIGGKDLYLMDESKQKVVDMKRNNTYSFDAKASSNFKIYYGDDLEKKIKPTKILLGKAYPNPSSGVTTVAFTLADQRTPYHVSLDIIDGMGRRVVTLVNGTYESGFYTSEWDASQQAATAGLYLYRLTVTGERGQETQIQKIIIKK